MDEDEVAKMYGEEIKQLKSAVDMHQGKVAKLSASNSSTMMRLGALQKKYDDLVANGGGGGAGGGGFQVSANDKQLYIATANMSLFRRTVAKEMDTEEKCEAVKGTLQCISVSSNWIWVCAKSGEVMLANVEAAVRALHSFIVQVEQGAEATPRGSDEAIHLEQMPSSFRSLKRLGQRLDESFALLNQVRLRPSVLPPCRDSALCLS